MPNPETLQREIKVISFDVYDTLLDRETVLIPAIQQLLDDEQQNTDARVFYRRYLAMHFRDSLIDSVIPGPHTPFKEISRRALTYRVHQADIQYTDGDIDRVIRAWNELEPYPDVDDTLIELAETYDLVGLSNGDPDMLSAVRPSFQVDLDEMISVAEAGAYKPHPAPYHRLVETYDVAPHEVLFVSAHTFDIVGAKAIGMRGCYVNRHSNPYGAWPQTPDLRIQSIDELPQLIRG